MKLRFNRVEAADAMASLCSVAAARTPKDILKCVCLEAKSDVLLMSATDLELSLISAVTQVETADPGKTVVVADTFYRILHEASDETMLLETDATQLHVKGRGSHFRIVTHDAEEFPAIPMMTATPAFTVDAKSLLKQVEWTVLAAARESSRYAIEGVLWDFKDGDLVLAATDGRRLSVAPGKVSGESNGQDSKASKAIVPTRALTIFSRLASDYDGPVGVLIKENLMLLNIGGAHLGTSLVEGNFPNYNDVIPGDCDQTATLERTEFLAALKQASLLTNEESKGVRLSFGKGDLTISSRAPEQGEATVSIPCKYDEEAIEIGFNPVFLVDVLRVAGSEEVTLSMKDANRPGVLRAQGDFLCVVMPVSLKSG